MTPELTLTSGPKQDFCDLPRANSLRNHDAYLEFGIKFWMGSSDYELGHSRIILI